MAKKTTNYRVEVFPVTSFGGDEATRVHCEYLVKEIKRHCDVEAAQIVCDHVCEFCGMAWELDLNGTPVCCGKAEAEHEANARTSTSALPPGT